MVLRVRELPLGVDAQAGRLLRVLLVWNSPLPAHSGKREIRLLLILGLPIFPNVSDSRRPVQIRSSSCVNVTGGIPRFVVAFDKA